MGETASTERDALPGVAELLIDARRGAGLSQSALAEATAIAQPNISAYESGRRSPTIRTLVVLLEACGYRLAIERA